MRRAMRVGLLVVLGAGLSACATADQWADWNAHSSHFASGEHLKFSVRNRGAVPRVNRQDVRLATAEGWWGEPVVVRPEQIFEN